MRAHGTTTFEGKSGYGLDHDTELAQLRAVRAAGGIPTWLGAHTVPPEFDDADAYLDFALAEVLPEAAQIAEAADVFLERGSFDAGQARRYLEACRDAGLALRLHGDQFTESGAIELAIDLEARSVDHLEATGPAGVAQLAASDVTGVLLPASALFLGRPMPPGRALADAGGLIALATDFNPGSAFCDSLPLVLSLACTQMKLAPEEALVAATANAAHVLGRGTGSAACGRASRPTSSSSTPRTGATSRTTSPATSSTRSSKAERWRSGGRHNPRDGDAKAAATAREGEAARVRPRLRRRGWRRAGYRARRAAEAARKGGRHGGATKTASKSTSGRRGREVKPPSWRKVLKRGAIFAPIFLATVMLLGGGKITRRRGGLPDAAPARGLRPVQLLHGPRRLAAAAEAPQPGLVGAVR